MNVLRWIREAFERPNAVDGYYQALERLKTEGCRVCSVCGSAKKLSEFSKAGKGYRTYCKKCEAKKQKESRDKMKRIEVTEKKCIKCGIAKPIDMFYKDNSKKDGHQSWCKDCAREYANKKKGGTPASRTTCK